MLIRAGRVHANKEHGLRKSAHYKSPALPTPFVATLLDQQAYGRCLCCGWLPFPRGGRPAGSANRAWPAHARMRLTSPCCDGCDGPGQRCTAGHPMISVKIYLRVWVRAAHGAVGEQRIQRAHVERCIVERRGCTVSQPGRRAWRSQALALWCGCTAVRGACFRQSTGPLLQATRKGECLAWRS